MQAMSEEQSPMAKVSEIYGSMVFNEHTMQERLPSATYKSLLKTIRGQVPALDEMPAGCRFSNRCPHATDLCVRAIPAVEQLNPHHRVACHYWKELTV